MKQTKTVFRMEADLWKDPEDGLHYYSLTVDDEEVEYGYCDTVEEAREELKLAIEGVIS